MTSSAEPDRRIGSQEPGGPTDPVDPAGRGGPKVVALGGGHGLAASLRAARSYAGSLAGVVSLGDDGGSSGRLRDELSVAPPGDLRRCLSALATDESLLVRSLEHRFDEGTLRGHPIGNLLLTGLATVAGDLQTAIDEVGRLVGAAGRIFPASDVPVTLIADSNLGTLAGQVTIERADGIRNLRFDPSDPPTSDAAIEAIVDADQVIIGPGSLFTSVLATTVVPGIRRALTESRASRVFVANVANEKGDARGFGLAEHVDALLGHQVPVDVVLTTSGSIIPRSIPVPVVTSDLAAVDGWSHDPKLLGQALADLAGWGISNGHDQR